MFTGIIAEMGELRARRRNPRSFRLEVGADLVIDELKPGESVAVNGVCLTVTSAGDDRFAADVMPETLRRSNLGELRPGDPVNLERALRAGDRLGGHFVTGHIDDVVPILNVEQEGNARLYDIELPLRLAPYVVEKGSVALDGISLTVAQRDAEHFTVSIVPHTARITTLSRKDAGDELNLEVDMLAKYVYSLIESRVDNDGRDRPEVTRDLLARTGFID